MCTLSAMLLPARHCRSREAETDGAVLRVVCNRDEKRTRAEALPPIRRTFGDRTGVLPIDPLSRGTWIGMNDAGLVLCLLNATIRNERNDATATRTGLLRSRGEIIPSLLACESVREAIDQAARLDAHQFPPFRLIAISRTQLGSVSSDHESLCFQPVRSMRAPYMATSSSLGDECVDPIRRELFAELFKTSRDALEAQHRFHTHQWADRKHLSVTMTRPDARTVSRTIAEVGRDCVRMTYCALSEIPTQSDTPESMMLELAPAEARV